MDDDPLLSGVILLMNQLSVFQEQTTLPRLPTKTGTRVRYSVLSSWWDLTGWGGGESQLSIT